jgi:hypothetical protein
MKELHFALPAGREVVITPKLVLNAGFAGRDQREVDRHINELEQFGVTRPHVTPTLYPISSYLLRQDRRIQVQHDRTSAEVEYVLFWAQGSIFVTVGSDHTDRELEAHAIPLAKQACPNLVAPAAWRLDDLEKHWDDLSLRCWTHAEGSECELYQDSLLLELLPPRYWIDFLGDRGEAENGTVLFSGTVPIKTHLPSYASHWSVELHDPHTNEEIRHDYQVVVLPGPVT